MGSTAFGSNEAYMAGDWIKMRVNLREDPAVISISEKLKLEIDAVVGKLHHFWSWADQQTENGNAHSVTYEWVDRYLSVTGFAQVMHDEGWLEHSGDGISIPNFDRHNGKCAKSRALTRERVKRFRNADVTLVTPKRREEKRRVLDHLQASPSDDPSASPDDNGKAHAERKPPTGDHAELITYFCERWKTIHPGKYDFKSGQDGAHIKAILTLAASPEMARWMVDEYLACDELFIKDKAHTLAMMRTNLNRWYEAAVRRHKPREMPRRPSLVIHGEV
jgi:hypothetical protein